MALHYKLPFLSHPMRWSAGHTGIVIQHRVGHHRRIIESGLGPPVLHMRTTDPPLSIRLLILPVVPWPTGRTIRSPLVVVSIGSRHISVIGRDTPSPGTTSSSSSPTVYILVLLIPLGEVCLAVPIRTTSVGSALIVRLIILLQRHSLLSTEDLIAQQFRDQCVNK